MENMSPTTRLCPALCATLLSVLTLSCTARAAAPPVAAAAAPAVEASAEAAPAEAAPAEEAAATRYDALKQVYDVAVQSEDAEVRVEKMTHVLNVAAYHMGMTPLEDLHLTEADRGETVPEIVVVLHGGEIPFFASENAETHAELLATARTLHDAGVRFRVCRGAAWLLHELKGEDMVDFVEMVPGGEAEIAWLQQVGFGYNFFQSQ